jgi:hypothetical protein
MSSSLDRFINCPVDVRRVNFTPCGGRPPEEDFGGEFEDFGISYIYICIYMFILVRKLLKNFV